MGRIANDIVDNINEVVDESVKIDSKKSKSLIKLIVSVSLTLIGLAFAIGQFRSTVINEMNSFETTITTQTTSIKELETKINTGFNEVDERIDKVYTDGLEAFDNYQEFNKEQLILVLDYGQDNKEMLKRMLELNSVQNRNEFENKMEEAKNDNENMFEQHSESKIVAVPIKNDNHNYMELNFVLNSNDDTTFYLTGATLEYVDNIDRNQYEIQELKKNQKYGDVYDVIYNNK